MKKEISDILKNQVFVMAAQFDRADDKDKPQYAQATCTLVAELVRNNVKHSTDIEKCLEKQLRARASEYIRYTSSGDEDDKSCFSSHSIASASIRFDGKTGSAI